MDIVISEGATDTKNPPAETLIPHTPRHFTNPRRGPSRHPTPTHRQYTSYPTMGEYDHRPRHRDIDGVLTPHQKPQTLPSQATLLCQGVRQAHTRSRRMGKGHQHNFKKKPTVTFSSIDAKISPTAAYVSITDLKKRNPIEQDSP
jgi:hypothetical protein